MKLIKLTEVAGSRKIYINSNCIVSFERLNMPEWEEAYTLVGAFYDNRFQFLRVKETVRNIQSQIDGKPNEVYIDKKLVGQRIEDIRLSKGMTLEEFGKMFGASKSNVRSWEIGKNLPNKKRLKNIADLAGITVQELLEG